MIEHTFDTDSGLLSVTYSGEIPIEEINSFGAFIAAARNLPKKLKILADARDASYSFSEEEVDNIMNNLQRDIAGYTLVDMAMLHSRPVETAYSLMLQKRNKQSTYKQAIFIEETNALKWLHKW